MDYDRYRSWLKTQPLAERTATNQLSRVRRLEAAFGDLDAAFARDDLQGVLGQLEYSRADAAAGRPLPRGIEQDGDAASTMATLRHAANKYLEFLETSLLISAVADIEAMRPVRPPRGAPGRKLRPTGYWAFQANPRRWDIDRWLAEREPELLYLVSSDDGSLMQAGDLAVLRRNATAGRPASVAALFEVLEAPRVRPEADVRFFRDPREGRPVLRAKLEVLAVLDRPLEVARLSAESQNLRARLQRSTVPIEPVAFEEIARYAGFSPAELAGRRAARSATAVAQIEQIARNLDPKRREAISHSIERGRIGEAVKAARGHRCQVCEGLGRSPIAFHKSNGTPYAEAHHVIPVHELRPGTLAPSNIMVLCPNHHRQAHHGAFAILRDDLDGWRIKIDGQDLNIAKTQL